MRIDLEKFFRAQDGYVCSGAQMKFLKKYGRRPKVTVRRIRKIMDRHGFVRVSRAFARAGLTKTPVPNITAFISVTQRRADVKYPIDMANDTFHEVGRKQRKRRKFMLRKLPKALMKDFKHA